MNREIKVYLTYRTIVMIDRLCKHLWVNEYCVAEWIVDWDSTVQIRITKDTLWILDELKDYLDD